MFDKILVALDLNDSYESPFAQALSLAAQTKAKLVLLQVLDAEDSYAAPFPYYAGTTGYPLVFDETLWSRYQAEYKAHQEQGKRILERLVKQAIAAGVNAEFIQAQGDAGKRICNCAQLQKVDLVIVGSHGRRGFQEFLMGSVSNYVMHRAPCTVMIAREKDCHKNTVNDTHNMADMPV
ncbi:MAG: universal stress protein [Phormidesmis sp.]